MLDGRYALRICVLNHTTGAADIGRLMDFFETAEPAVQAPPLAPLGYERDHVVRAAPLRRRVGGGAGCGVAASAIAGLELFAPLSESACERIAALARIEERAAGEAIVEQWEVSLDFFVIVAGAVEVHVGGTTVARLGRGKFFGEVAALDWGGGYGYPRIASVRALEATTLLTFPGGAMNEIACDHPRLARRIRRIAQERLRAGSR
jgi:CRP-like cAMP-binding protein